MEIGDVQPAEPVVAPPLGIADVIERTGAPAWKLRDLEAKGLIPPIARGAAGERLYTEANVAAITAVLQSKARRQTTARAAARPAAATTPVPANGRHEIMFCRECGRQLKDGEYASACDEILVTEYGSLITTTATCPTHHKAVALKTEFVAPGRPETSE